MFPFHNYEAIFGKTAVKIVQNKVLHVWQTTLQNICFQNRCFGGGSEHSLNQLCLFDSFISSNKNSCGKAHQYHCLAWGIDSKDECSVEIIQSIKSGRLMENSKEKYG